MSRTAFPTSRLALEVDRKPSGIARAVFFFVAIAVVLVWMVVCAGIGVLWALVENSVGAGIIGGFILWAISCLFFDYAWTDLTVAWWGVIAGAIIGLYLTYQEVKYMF